jgi:hypothetical protein
MEPAPFSPDIILNDFWLFPKIKSALKGRRLQDAEKKKNVIMALKAVPQHEFQKCLYQWQHHWVKCITSQGEYFKGDPSQ